MAEMRIEQISMQNCATEEIKSLALPVNKASLFSKPCPICQKVIKGDNMKRHLKIHKGTRYQCPECPTTVGRQDQARLHLLRVHNLDPAQVAEMKIEQFVLPNSDTEKVTEIEAKEKTDPLSIRSEMPLPSNPCPICQKVIKGNHMRRHLEIHKGIRYQCPECPITVSRPDEARHHLLRVHNLDPSKVAEMQITKVIVLNSNTQKVIDLQEKLLLDGEDTSDEPSMSDEVSPSRRLAIGNGTMDEDSDSDGSDPDDSTDQAGKSTTSSTTDEVLEINVNEETTPSATKTCPVCNKVIKGTNMRRHLDIHRGTRYQCPQCPKQLSRVSEVRLHLTRVHHIDRTQLSGYDINPVTLTKSDSDRLIKIEYTEDTATDDEPATDDDGSTETTTTVALSGSSELSLPSNQCPICQKVIKGDNMRRHLEIHKGTRYQCPKCPITAGRRYEAKLHLLKVHHLDATEVAEMKIKSVILPNNDTEKVITLQTQLEDLEREECPICHKVIKGMLKMQRHLATHNGTRYQCPVCSKTYCRISETRLHLMRVHHIDRDELAQLEIHPVILPELNDEEDDSIEEVQVKEEADELADGDGDDDSDAEEVMFVKCERETV